MFKLLMIGICTLIMSSLHAENTTKVSKAVPVTTYKLRKGIWLNGNVHRAKTVKLSFENRGRVSYLMPIDQHAASAVYNKNGMIIQKGDVIAKIDPTYYDIAVRQNEAVLKGAQASMNEAASSMKRNAKLATKGAVSQKDVDKTNEIYENSLSTFLRAKENLLKSKMELDACYLRAPFYGQIEEHYQTIGNYVSPGEDVLRLSVSSPAMIKVNMPASLSRQVSINDSITVYPVNSDTPIPVWFDFSHVDTNNIDFFVKNPVVTTTKLTEKQTKMVNVHKLSFVAALGEQDNKISLWIPTSAVWQDKKGTFVWKAVNQKIAVLNKPIEREFNLKKVYIKTSDRFMFLGIYHYQLLADDGHLKKYDVVVSEKLENCKDGERVVFSPEKWLFRPDEKVIVNIIPYQQDGYYLPRNYVIKESEISYIYVVKDQKLHKLNIKIGGDYACFFRVESPELIDGLKVVVPENLEQLHDQRPVVIKKRLGAFQIN